MHEYLYVCLFSTTTTTKTIYKSAISRIKHESERWMRINTEKCLSGSSDGKCWSWMSWTHWTWPSTYVRSEKNKQWWMVDVDRVRSGLVQGQSGRHSIYRLCETQWSPADCFISRATRSILLGCPFKFWQPRVRSAACWQTDLQRNAVGKFTAFHAACMTVKLPRISLISISLYSSDVNKTISYKAKTTGYNTFVHRFTKKWQNISKYTALRCFN